MQSTHTFTLNNQPQRYYDHIPNQQTSIYPLQTCPKIYTLVAYTIEQQISIKNNLTWRQATSMPIIKVVKFDMEQIKQ